MSPTAGCETPLKALIIGCGRIAGGYDEKRDDAEPGALSHAGAYVRDPRFSILACVDPDPRARQRFAARWSVPFAAPSLDAAPAAIRAAVDVISVCAPTAAHAQTLRSALTLSPKAVWAEKPLTGSLADSRAIVKAYRRAGAPIMVNFPRRWLPEIAGIAQEARAGAFGRLLLGVGYYGKGARNAGAHMLDLIGRFADVTMVAAGAPRYDHWPDDPTLDMTLAAANARIDLKGVDQRAFQIFELSLIYERAAVVFEEGCRRARLRRVRANPLFPQHAILDRGAVRAVDLLAAAPRALDDLYAAATAGETLCEALDAALAVEALLEDARRLAGLTSRTP